jgi:hypothetical protein
MATIKDQETKPQVSDQLDRMKNQLSQLKKSIDDLRAHLQPVLRTPEDKGPISAKDEEQLVDLANCIRGGVRGISEATREIGLMIHLLEL